MSKEDVILAAIKNGGAVWEELKKDWYKKKLPGSAYLPAEFVAKLLIGHLGMTTDDVYRALEEAQEISVDKLKQEKVLSGSFRITEDIAKIVMALILDIPEVAAEEYAAPEIPAEESVEEEEPDHDPYSFTTEPDSDSISPFEDATERAVSSESVAPPVTECPHCAHDFERCENGFYDKQVVEHVEPTARFEVSRESSDASNSKGCVHVGTDNKCVDCTDEVTIDCYGCEEKIITSKAIKCKDFEDCDHAYCSSCAEDNISAAGFCNDCAKIQCDGCNTDELENGTQKNCKNPECKKEPDYCEDCALSLLNKKGLCSSCSGEEVVTCAGDCQGEFTESLVVKCKDFDDCEHAYCSEDAKNELNRYGFCTDCAEIDCDGEGCTNTIENGRQKKCKNPECDYASDFCDDCAKRLLNRKGECSGCSGEGEFTCDGDCGEQYTASLIKKCRNFDTCQQTFCLEDARSALTRGYCEECYSAQQTQRTDTNL